jgi:hypothetical protein
MKVECPVCHREGVVEQRGNSVRFVHYEYIDGRRVFTRHTVKGTDGNMGTMGTEKTNTSVFTENRLAVGLRRGARGPLNRKPSIGRVESLGEASKIVRIPQSANRDYPSLGAGGRGAAFVGRLWTAFARRTWPGPGGSNLSLDVQRLRGCGYE